VWNIWRRLSNLERKVNTMASALDNLVANEASLETTVTAIADDNAKLHKELTDALAAPQIDPAAVQAVADKIAAQQAKLAALVPAATVPPVAGA
jgi:peptidoglycan hydrolase CwlO-like protein